MPQQGRRELPVSWHNVLGSTTYSQDVVELPYIVIPVSSDVFGSAPDCRLTIWHLAVQHMRKEKNGWQAQTQVCLFPFVAFVKYTCL